MHIISSRYQDVANDYDDYDYDYDDYEKDKNNKSTNRITMRSSSTSSSTLVSFPSRILMLLLVGLYSVAIALALRPSPSSSSYSSSHLHLHSHSHFSRPTSSSSSQTSSSIVAMEAVPGKKFNNLRKKLFSRTRRGYRNDGDDAGDAGDAAGEDEIGETVVETDELIILKENVKVKDKNKNKNRYSSYLASSSLKLRKKKKKQQQQQPPHVVETVEELRSAILDQQLSLSDTAIVEPKKTPPPPPVQLLLDDDTDDGDDDIVAVTAEEEASSSSSSSPPLMDHAVRNLIKERYLNGSTPGNRLASDNSTLALAIEGGGMRGCVSAGMAAAITALGLSDAIDTIYGSSAGSVVGAYMVSRQVCLDVYVDILPASKKLFVCKKRMLTNLASLSLGRMLTRRSKSNNNNNNSNNKNAENRASLSSIRERLYKTQPGMNISFVLDGIMGNDHGLRPLDIDAFQQNDMKQKLRVVSSCVDPHTGKLFSKCFGSDDFFHDEHAVVRVDHQREGLFACLQASMTVPGATGPPVNLVRKKISNNSTDHLNGQQQQQLPLPCFDAFCFEPIPYRSAVEEGATHVLVLATRPEDFVPKTKPSIYESGVAPLYFNSHGHSSVAEFFEQGGQQYVYAEDLMLLEEAKRMRPSSGSSSSLEEQERGALIPPPEILYGVPRTNEITQRIQNREQNWNRAHLFPLRVPKGHKELEVLDQDKDAVLEAVRGGFMTAFDSLSDLVGLEGFRGKDVAEMIFPSSLDGGNNDDDDDNNNNNNNNNNNSKSSTSTSSPTSLSALDEAILGTKLHVPGEPIREYGAINSTMSFGDNTMIGGGGLFGHGSHHDTEMNQRQRQEEFSRTLLQCLPGFQDGRYGHLAKGLRQQIEQGSGSSSCSSSSSSTGYVRPNSRF